MKKLRKWIALLLVSALVFDARVPVFAAGTGNVNNLIHYDEFESGLENRCETAYSGALLMIKGQSVPLGKKGFVSDNPAVVAVSGVKAVAKKSGKVQYSIRFYKINLTDNTFTYSLNTKTSESLILYGMKEVSGEENFQFNASEIDAIYDRINQINS